MAIENSTEDPFDVGPEDTALSDPPAATEAGEGGGDMLAWYYSRSLQYERLIRADFTNESSFTLPKCVIESGNQPFNRGFEEGEFEFDGTPAGSSLLGTGGSDMTVWSLSRQNKLRELGTGTFENKSSYPIPHGIIDTGGWNVPFEDGEYEFPDEIPEGALLGRNVFNLNLFGLVNAVPDPDSPDIENAVRVGNANIRIWTIDIDEEGQEIEIEAEVRSAADGIYVISPPAWETVFFVEVSHAYLGTVVQTVEIDQVDVEENIFMQLPRGGSLGLNAGGSGVSMG